jgi:myo-inositol-1(or 4)-monophosphatase
MHPYVNTAAKAARTAGDIIMRGFSRLDKISINKKSAKDFVTNIDKSAEASIIETLQMAYPYHSFLAEESGKTGHDDFQWIIDPLDGTMNFIHGVPHFCISIALKQQQRIIHGVIYDPVRDELFTASRGEGAFVNNRRMRVSSRYTLEDCLVAVGMSVYVTDYFDSYFDMLKTITSRCASIRRAGSSALDLAYVAAGRLDGYIKLGLKPWDIAAGALLIQEAGGLMSDITGSEDYMRTGHVIAANPKAFKEFLKIVHQTLKPAPSVVPSVAK